MALSDTLKKHIEFIIKYGGIYASIASFLSDFFKPVIDSTLIFAIIATLFSLTLLIFYILHYKFKLLDNLNTEIYNRSNGYWFKTVFLTSLMCCIIFNIMYFINKNTPDGYLSEKSSMIKNLQGDIGLINIHLNDIKEDTHKIADQTKEIEKNTRETTELLKESISPSDPKAKIASLGLSYTSEIFQQKILEGDKDITLLFLQAGMNPNIILSDKTNPIYTAVLKETPNYKYIYELAINFGFTPNKAIKIDFTNQMGESIEDIIYKKFFVKSYNLLRAAFGSNKIYFPDNFPFNLGSLLSFKYLTPNNKFINSFTNIGIDFKDAISDRNDVLKHVCNIVEEYINNLKYQINVDNINFSFINDLSNYDKLLNINIQSDEFKWLGPMGRVYLGNSIISYKSYKKMLSERPVCSNYLENQINNLPNECYYIKNSYDDYNNNRKSLINEINKIKNEHNNFANKMLSEYNIFEEYVNKYKTGTDNLN